MRPALMMHKKIYYHDTDALGLVHHAAYFAHLEEARYVYCADRGVDLWEYARRGISFPAVHVEIEYKSPARYGERICIYTRPQKIGTSSVHFFQEIKKDGLVVVAAKTVWACIGATHISVAVPQAIKTALES